VIGLLGRHVPEHVDNVQCTEIDCALMEIDHAVMKSVHQIILLKRKQSPCKNAVALVIGQIGLPLARLVADLVNLDLEIVFVAQKLLLHINVVQKKM